MNPINQPNPNLGLEHAANILPSSDDEPPGGMRAMAKIANNSARVPKTPYPPEERERLHSISFRYIENGIPEGQRTDYHPDMHPGMYEKKKFFAPRYWWS